MRTHDEILAKIHEKQTEFLPWWFEILIEYLPLEIAQDFLVDTPKIWEIRSLERADIVEQMANYMSFAWEKVDDHRGISAQRSVEKMGAWIWLLNEENELVLENYPYLNYGAPKLSAVCKHFGFPIPDIDSIANMVKGKPCRDGCREGCEG